MKALALPIIVGALSLYGSAFFGVWTAPGLEGLPTYKVVLNHFHSKTPAAEVPEIGLTPVPATVQFLPHGVTADWGDVPVVNLPDRKPEQSKMKKDRRPAAIPPAAPRRVVSAPAPKAPEPAAPKPSTSYQLEGSSVRFQR